MLKHWESPGVLRLTHAPDSDVPIRLSETQSPRVSCFGAGKSPIRPDVTLLPERRFEGLSFPTASLDDLCH